MLTKTIYTTSILGYAVSASKSKYCTHNCLIEHTSSTDLWLEPLALFSTGYCPLAVSRSSCPVERLKWADKNLPTMLRLR